MRALGLPAWKTTGLVGAIALVAAACSPTGVETAPDQSATALTLDYVKANFDRSAMTREPELVECTLSGGAKTQCISMTFGPAPQSQKIGPFCPRNIADGPDKSGIWIESGKVYDADGAFVAGLPDFYHDKEFVLYDKATGKVRVTDSKMACEAAARPDVAKEYRKYCVECEVSYVPKGTTLTYVIPIRPMAATEIARRVTGGGVGVSFGGARLDAPAPTDAILAAHTLAPFDDCGGHVNPHVGYHLHAATDCLLKTGKKSADGIAVGIALDGYPILARLMNDGKEPGNLDQCRGHISVGSEYHYHANAPGSNAILPCHTGQTGCSSEKSDGVCDASKQDRRGPPGGGPPPGDGPRPGNNAGGS